MSKWSNGTKYGLILITFGIVLISFNLRAPMIAVGPIVDLISAEYGLSATIAGMITAIPLIAFAAISPFVPRLSDKVGFRRLMFIGLVMMIIGEAVRSFCGLPGLFIGTAVMGLGIGIGNVLIPCLIKLTYKTKAGSMIGVYTTCMSIFAAIGAGTSIPLATGLGWNVALALWIVLAVVALVVWSPQAASSEEKTCAAKTEEKKSIWKSPVAWWVTLYMGMQSLLFYTLVAWYPTIIVANGMSESFSGTMAMLFQLISIPVTLLVPIIASRMKDQKMIAAAISAGYLVGLLLIFSTSEIPMVVSVILTGLGAGGCISLAISYISMRTDGYRTSADLSGMSQSFGYLLAAIGPMLIGSIFDMTGTWTWSISTLIVLEIFVLFAGVMAGRNKSVEASMAEHRGAKYHFPQRNGHGHPITFTNAT